MTAPQHNSTVYLSLLMKKALCKEKQQGASQPASGKQSSGLDSLLETNIFLKNGAVQRSWVSQTSSKSKVTKTLLSRQYVKGVFDLLFVHDFYLSPSRTCCPVEDSPPSRDTAQTLGGCSSAHVFVDSKIAKEKCILPLRYPCVLYWGFWQLHCKFLLLAGKRDRHHHSPILDAPLLFPLKYAKQLP